MTWNAQGELYNTKENIFIDSNSTRKEVWSGRILLLNSSKLAGEEWKKKAEEDLMMNLEESKPRVEEEMILILAEGELKKRDMKICYKPVEGISRKVENSEPRKTENLNNWGGKLMTWAEMLTSQPQELSIKESSTIWSKRGKGLANKLLRFATIELDNTRKNSRKHDTICMAKVEEQVTIPQPTSDVKF